MIFTLTDREYNVLDAYETDDYLIGNYIGTIIKTLDINVLVKSEKAQDWNFGNYIMCEDATGYKYWFTIYDVEDSYNADEKRLTCYSGTIDIVSEDANPVARPSEPQPFSYYFNRILNDTGITIGLNEISHLSRTLEYTSESVSNAEMLQYVLNGFEAEADLAVEFSGSKPTALVLNVFRRIGKEEPQTTLTDEDDSLTALDRTGSISDLATALNPVGKTKTVDEVELSVTLVGKYYEEKDENNNILYYSPKDDFRVYSIEGRRNFYVQLPGKTNGEFDGYINRRYKSEAATPDALWTESVSQLKKIDHPTVTYEAKGNIDCQIGDNIQIISNEMQPPVMISARVLEYKFNDDDPTRNEYKFGNYQELESNIGQVSKMIEEIKKSIIYIRSQVVEYVISSQGDVPPIDGWSTEKPSMENGDWLWIRTTTTLSNGDQTVAYSISYAGNDGEGGAPGNDGKTAYELAVENGYTGSETQWLADLKGDPGQNAIIGYLTNETIAVPASNTGVVSDWSGANGYYRVMDGNTQALSGIVFSVVSATGCTTTIDAAGVYKITAMSGDFGTATYQAVYKEAVIQKIVMIVKNKQGPTGPKGEPTGLIEQAAEPDLNSRYVGMLWTNTADGVTRRWNGSKWDIFLISVENLNVINLSAINNNLGTVTAGILKSLDGQVEFDLDNKKLKLGNTFVWDGSELKVRGKINADENILMYATELPISGDMPGIHVGTINTEGGGIVPNLYIGYAPELPLPNYANFYIGDPEATATNLYFAGVLKLKNYIELANNTGIKNKSPNGIVRNDFFRGPDDWLHINRDAQGRTRFGGIVEVSGGDTVIGTIIEMSNNQAIYQKNTSKDSYRSMLRGTDNWLHINPDSYGRSKIHGVTELTTLNVSGAKNAIHVVRDGVRATPAYETAESYLGDIGEATTGSECSAEIAIEDLFGDTVNTTIPYQVFLQSYGDGYIWVSERLENKFIVKSNVPNVHFAWEIKAKRRGFEHERLVLQEEYTNEIIQKSKGLCGPYAVSDI